MISPLAVIHPNVHFGENCEVEPFAIVGAPPRNCAPGELKTVIGANSIIRSHVVIYAGNTIGNGFQCGNKANVRELNTIGDDVSIGTLSVIEHHVTIGNSVRIHTHVFVPEFTILDDQCWLGPNVIITNAKYPRSPKVKENLKGAHVKKHALIGANSTLLPGITIGIHSLVGAGSVVTKDVVDRTVVVGNPAKFLKFIDALPY